MSVRVCIYLQNHNIIITEGTKLWSPGSIAPDNLVDEILKVQSQLFYTHTLQERARKTDKPVGWDTDNLKSL